MLSSRTAESETALDDTLQLITPGGRRIPNEALDPWVENVAPAELRALHRDMVAVRRIDSEGMALQRQGQLALWAPALGQEGVQVGTARAFREDDFVFPSYREIGVSYVRGAELVDFISVWRGEEHSSFNPYDINTATPQIIIGAQTLHAVGYAMGIQRDALIAEDPATVDQVAITYFGDGASSQGDVNEAMVFASSFHAPVVFVCTNNQWAISEPVTVQSKFPIAGRAPGFGIPSMRVDGNDALACLAAMRVALHRARTGGGPTFIEAVTYRMGPHTTADDPTRYRSKDELEMWRGRDPIDRVAAHLRSIDEFSDEHAAEVAAFADETGAALRAACLGHATKSAIEVFDHVYEEPHSGLYRERAHFAAYLDGFPDDSASDEETR